MKSIIKALKIHHVFSSPLAPLSPPFVRTQMDFFFFIRANLLGVFGNTAGLTMRLCCSLFNLISTVLGDKELEQIIPAGSWSD